MDPIIPDSDLVVFEEDSEPDIDCSLVWRALIVDDEPDVHQTTLMAMKDVLIEGRRLEFVHAYSAAEARDILMKNTDLAFVLLDVVMETDNAGLQLVHFIRKELGNLAIRIILRTGQPGFAPEIETIRSYDINDYKTKSELTRIRLFASLTVAVRSYWQIHQLEANRRGLELIVASSNELSKPSGLGRFSEGVVTQLCALLGIDEEGIVCAASEVSGKPPYILAAAGRFSEWIGQALENIPDHCVRRELGRTLTERCHSFGETTCLFFSVPGDYSLAAFVDVKHPPNEIDRNLLAVFCNNIAVAFENVRLYNRITMLAYEDPLLKLPNRNSFLSRIDQRNHKSDRLALVDLDSFADINSILDQDFGDAVLTVVGQRLRETFAENVVVSRVGSDVFGILGPQDEVNATKITSVFAEPFAVLNESLRLSATTGMVNLADSSLKAVELLKNAGVALKQAKNYNRGKTVLFENVHATEARERMQMLSKLRLAFSAERLFLVYQPFVDLASGRIVGAEVLLRWRTDQGEFIPPDRFIPLAEQSGLMVPIGEWVIRSALRYLKQLTDQGYHDFRMAINVSHVQFREPNFVELLVSAIRAIDVDPANVEIELTESVAIDNIDLIDQKLLAIHEAGVAIAIDDFGTGYSSLNILRKLSVDRIKIDRAFISGTDSLQADYSIAEMILHLAAQLGLETIAEGIETQAQHDKLRSLGCRDGQGYYYSRPVTGDAFQKLIQQH